MKTFRLWVFKRKKETKNPHTGQLTSHFAAITWNWKPKHTHTHKQHLAIHRIKDTPKSKGKMPGLIGISEFVDEAIDDYNSPTTSTFVSKMAQCRQTVSGLEDVSSPFSISFAFSFIMFIIFRICYSNPFLESNRIANVSIIAKFHTVLIE